QGGLAVTERNPAGGEHDARGVVPAKDSGRECQIEVVAGPRAKPVELALDTDGTELFADPRVDGRIGKRVRRFPAGCTILERDRRIEGSGLEPEPITGKGIGPELQVGFREVDGIPVIISPR